MALKVRTVSSNHAIHSAAEIISQFLYEWRTVPILFLSSGGSSIAIVNEIKLPESIMLTVGLTDERYSRDSAVNNLLQLGQQAGFMIQAETCNVQWLDTVPQPDESQTDWANRYEIQLKNWRVKHPEGKIVATLGVGPDGHCVGIMPYPEDPIYFHQLFMETEKWVVAYDAGNKNPHKKRMTITKAVIEQIDLGVSYIIGEAKKSVIERIMAKTETEPELPGLLLHRPKVEIIVTDQSIENTGQ